MIHFLYGAIAMCAATLALFFLRFYRRTADRFFLYFCASFFLEALSRVAFVALDQAPSDDSWYYLLRIVEYGLILVAIVDKNIVRRPRS